jgi:hypothetical protein
MTKGGAVASPASRCLARTLQAFRNSVYFFVSFVPFVSYAVALKIELRAELEEA